jgi:hypothetical protein
MRELAIITNPNAKTTEVVKELKELCEKHGDVKIVDLKQAIDKGS